MSNILKYTLKSLFVGLQVALGYVLISALLKLFFYGADSFSDLSVSAVLYEFCTIVAVVTVILVAWDKRRYFLPFRSRASESFEKPRLSLSTRVLIAFLGLPLAGLLLSMIPVRLIEMLGIDVSAAATTLVFTFVFWMFFLVKYKDVYFAKSR